MPKVTELERYCCTLYDTRDQLKRHIFDRSDRAFEEGDRARDRIADLEQLKARQARMKEAFLASIGGLPSSDTPLLPRITGTSQGSGYRVENVVFQSRPGQYVTANLYVPDSREERSAAVLFVCGHEYEGKHCDYYHEVCLHFVRAGMIVLAVDPIGQGERISGILASDGSEEVISGTREHQHFGVKCHLLGESVARYFIHDAMRAIDYLCERPEVDPARIAITGNSGGGLQTAMMMVCDDRLTAAAPGTFIMNRQQYMHAGGVQDAEQIWAGLTAVGFDHEDLLLSFAPKPLLVLAVQYDFFPIEATRRTVSRCERFWEMHGRDGNLLLAEDVSTHRYTDQLARTAAAFFSSHLSVQKMPEAAIEPDFAPLPAERLLCTDKGQVVLSLPGAKTAQDEIVARCEQLKLERNRLSPDERRRRALVWLNEKVSASRSPCEFNVRRVFLQPADGLQVEYRLWWSQTGVMNSGYVFRSENAAGDEPQSFVLGVWLGGTSRLTERWSWIQDMCHAGKTVLVLNASGVGPHEPYPIYNRPAHTFFGFMHTLADNLIWLGDSLAALHAYDITRCLDMIAHVEKVGMEAAAVDVHAAGRQEHVVRLAAVLDRRIGRITSDSPVGSVSDWVQATRYEEEDVMSTIVPGLLRYMDTAEWEELYRDNS
ncbi:alpha/beta hydrolase family protein [Paenibacillus hodogayensis]|uniref:Alpha/beta hydrolase family protein n=1 Tax=Paenibacillus hodogayensis TaxID=279208 RepID=A0ABV5VQY1_9BACL